MLAVHRLTAIFALLFSVANCWSITKGEVTVAGSGDPGDPVRFEQLTGPVELYSGKTLDISFAIPESKPAPQQIALRLSPSGAPAGSVDKTVAAKQRQKIMHGVIPFKQIPLELQNRNLDVTLFVSGGSGKPYTAKLFDLVVYGDDDAGPGDLTPVQAAGTGAKLVPLPEILYHRRADPRHVNPVIALIFVGAIDVLFGAFLLALSGDVGSFAEVVKQLRASQVAMVLSVLAMELLFVAYYIQWSIFSVITASALLLPLVYLSGRRAVPS